MNQAEQYLEEALNYRSSRPPVRLDQRVLSYEFRDGSKLVAYSNKPDIVGWDVLPPPRIVGQAWDMLPRYVRASPCPGCGHDALHRRDVALCEAEGCECDQTTVNDFWKAIAE